MRNTYRCCHTITMATLCDKLDDVVLRILVGLLVLMLAVMQRRDHSGNWTAADDVRRMR